MAKAKSTRKPAKRKPAKRKSAKRPSERANMAAQRRMDTVINWRERRVKVGSKQRMAAKKHGKTASAQAKYKKYFEAKKKLAKQIWG